LRCGAADVNAGTFESEGRSPLGCGHWMVDSAEHGPDYRETRRFSNAQKG